MKKLLALALAVVMMMAIAIPAFAAAATPDPVYSERFGDGNDDSAADNYLEDADDSYTKPEVEVKYGVAQAYTAFIPEAINFHEQKVEADGKTVGYVYSEQTVTLTDVIIAKGEYLNVYVASQNVGSSANTTWFLVDDENKDDVANKGANVSYAARTDRFLTSDDETIKGLANKGGILTCAAADGNKGTTGSNATTQLYFSSKGTAQEGTYIDYLTFTVAVQAEPVDVVNN